MVVAGIFGDRTLALVDCFDWDGDVMLDDGDELLERYRHVREINRLLLRDLVTLVPREAIVSCARQLGLWEDGRLVFENEQDASILYDYCIYDWRAQEDNLARKALDDAPPPPEDSDEYDVLESMANARYALMQVGTVVEGVGIEAYDSLHLSRVTLIDIGLSQCVSENAVIASRIIPFRDFVMTSGVPLAAGEDALAQIKGYLEERLGGGEDWFMDLDDTRQSEITAGIIRILLDTGASQNVRYEEPSHERESHG